MPSNKILKLQVELIPAPRREDGKIYKGILERTVKPIQPDELHLPIQPGRGLHFT